MQIDWTTLTLEAINFLVLVWLLTRFFYRPVLAVIEARKAATARAIADAEALRREAEALKRDCERRLADLDRERAAAEARIEEEIAAERARRLAAMEAELAAERRRREALEARERSEREAALERQAAQLAGRFASRLLERLASPELNAMLADLALCDLQALSGAGLEALRAALRDAATSVRVVSAWPLDEARRAAFTRALNALADGTSSIEFADDASLKAGVCIVAGAWVLMANLRDELAFFSGSLEHGG